MVLPDNLLSPIAGPNPSGENLRYTPVSKRDPTFFYDKISEARREEEDVGEWEVKGKKADYDLVIKLATEAIANRTKDLQIAAWVTEALLCKYGFAGLREGLDLLRGLVENFWDTVYPELEDGDAEFRAGPLNWIGTRIGKAVRLTPLTKDKPPLTKTGFNWFDYQQSKTVPTEEQAAENETKKADRDQAIAEKKVTPEEFNEVLTATRKVFCRQLANDLESSLESLEALDGVCNEKFGDVAPSFGNLRRALEEVHVALRVLLKRKEEQEPDPPSATEEVSEGPAETGLAAEAETTVAEQGEGTTEQNEGTTEQAATRRVVTEEPADRDDAIRRVVAVAHFLRQQEPYSPVPYLMLRGLRWGELRASGGQVDITLLEAPTTEIRQQIKRAAVEFQWAEVLEAAETAVGMPCGRGWLDPHRYIVKACTELGSYYDPIATAVRSELRTLLADYPQLPELTLMDDTPVANAETQAWLRDEIIPPKPASAPTEAGAAPTMPAIERGEPKEEGTEGEGAPPDVYELAKIAAQQGNVEDAITMLSAAISQERSGRARFQRKIQLAGICMATGNESIAYPILGELRREIEERKLEEWEVSEAVAQPLTLLYRCLLKLDHDGAEKQKIYEKICRLDPVQALSCLK